MFKSVPFPIVRSAREGPQNGVGALEQDVYERANSEAPSVDDRSTYGVSNTQLGLLIFIAWTVVGAFQNIPELIKALESGTAVPWYIFLGRMIESWVWALMTPILLSIDRNLHSRSLAISSVVFIFLGLSIPLVVLHTYITGLILYPIKQITWSPFRSPDYTVYYNLGGWTMYCGAVGILQAIRFYNKSLLANLKLERAERGLLESRINALRLHLEPHFLSNALNAISSEVESRPRQARRMIANLGVLLRRSLDYKESPLISLAHELALLDHYLAIQRIRFGERIDIKVEAEPDALPIRVPSMLLQPLVENAFRHGVEGKRSGGTIIVTASVKEGFLSLSVKDNGKGLPRNWKLATSSGHGLRVTRERLLALYGGRDGSLSVVRRTSGGTEVTVRLPAFPKVKNDLGN